MTSRISWKDIKWSDPDGGTITLHGTIPTLVYPRKLRPSEEWHGLALLESSEVVDLWIQEEKDEKESSGVNMAHALVSGGTMGLYLNDLIQIDDITVGRFPDPEPRRVHRLANRHKRPVYFIEPEIDDQQWEDLQKIKQLDNRSVNSYINEGIRLVVKEKLQQISTMKKNRNTLEDMVSI